MLLQVLKEQRWVGGSGGNPFSVGVECHAEGRGAQDCRRELSRLLYSRGELHGEGFALWQGLMHHLAEGRGP